MTKLQMNELHKLSVKDKIKVVQSLWDDIAAGQAIDNLPPEHKKNLQERLLKIESGESQFIPWSEIQTKFKGI